MSLAILAHDRFPHEAKTAVGMLRYGERDVSAVLDGRHAGDRVHDHLPDVEDAPIVRSMADVDDDVDALVIGIAPVGGGLAEAWRPDIVRAIERGCDVISGLHTFVGDDDELADLAADHGVTIHDVRRPPPDLDIASGLAGDVDATVVLTVGTDCSVGKMTTSMEFVGALRDAGFDAGMVPTGQTGIMIEGWGIAIDAVPTDFAAGAVERLVTEAAEEHDVVVVEGQASITHPGYSGLTCSILHGAMPDALVLCHEAGRDRYMGWERFELPPIEAIAAQYELVAEPLFQTSVVAGALDTSGIPDPDAAGEELERYARSIGGSAVDPVRGDPAELIEVIV